MTVGIFTPDTRAPRLYRPDDNRVSFAQVVQHTVQLGPIPTATRRHLFEQALAATQPRHRSADLSGASMAAALPAVCGLRREGCGDGTEPRHGAKLRPRGPRRGLARPK